MSSQAHWVITGEDPTEIILKLKTNHAAQVLDAEDTITAVIKRGGTAVSTVATVSTDATGTDLTIGKIVASWTAVESATWAPGTATLWITRNGKNWLSEHLRIKEGP